MGGAQYFWRVTRQSGEGQEGVFDVEEYICGLGMQPIRPIPYKMDARGVDWDDMLYAIRNSTTHLGEKVLKCCRRPNESVELYYDWTSIP